MMTTYSDPTLTARTSGTHDFKALLLEPFLVVAVSAFWLVTLPFAAVSLLAVKISDTYMSFTHRSVVGNPLILRRGAVQKTQALAPRRSPRQAEI